jgi:hypothetical protein
MIKLGSVRELSESLDDDWGDVSIEKTSCLACT